MSKRLNCSILLGGMLFSTSLWGQAIEPACQAEHAWKVAWERFYHPSTHLFYDYISSYERGKELAHLPTKAEVERQYPNPCGYGTGMEDCAILTGTMLETLVDRFSVNPDERISEQAAAALRGLASCSLIEEAPGFVARGICPEDGKSYYINSSRDQYTHCVYGLWRYYRSPLAGVGAKDTVRRILLGIADRMIRNVTPAHNYDFLRADGEPCPLGICRMWNVQSHEAARLPMFYAAAWDVTGEKRYYDQYRKYVVEAVRQSETIGKQHAAYVFVQILYSFDLLLAVEKDSALREDLAALRRRVAAMSLERAESSLAKLKTLTKKDLAVLGPDWRLVERWDRQGGYLIPRWGEYRKTWDLIREVGESTLAVFMAGDVSMREKALAIQREYLSLFDYDHLSSCGIIYHVAAYWESLKNEP